MPRELRLVDRLTIFGLTVVEVEGWRTRGSESFSPQGVVCHHTAGSSTGEIGSLRILINGRSDLPGPLCQIGLGRSGRCYVIAAGRANHAGSGGWRGLRGNSSVFGIEAENDGRQPWPQVQLDAYYKLAAALISLTPKRDPGLVCAHREWAPGRKPDPHSIDMTAFRMNVASILANPSAPPPGVVVPKPYTIQDPEGPVKKTTYLVSSDDSGSGFYKTDIEWARYAGVLPPSSFPPVDGYWDIGEWGCQERDGKALICFRGVRPRLKFQVVVLSLEGPIA